jgi:hypothetical protein
MEYKLIFRGKPAYFGMRSKSGSPWNWPKGNRPNSIPMQSETAWAMRAKDCLDFKYPTISLAFLKPFSAMEKVS